MNNHIIRINVHTTSQLCAFFGVVVIYVNNNTEPSERFKKIFTISNQFLKIV